MTNEILVFIITAVIIGAVAWLWNALVLRRVNNSDFGINHNKVTHSVEVYRRTPLGNILIKEFPYAESDTEDYEFQVREAEELIENLRS